MKQETRWTLLMGGWYIFVAPLIGILGLVRHFTPVGKEGISSTMFSLYKLYPEFPFQDGEGDVEYSCESSPSYKGEPDGEEKRESHV